MGFIIENLEDAELLSNYRKTKDQKYISLLFHRYMPFILGSCITYLKNMSDAEDAVMDIYEKIVVKTQSMEITYFKSWIYAVTRNHCLERLRKQNTRASKETQAEYHYYEDNFHPDAYEINIKRDQQINILHQCMDKLASDQRKIVNLFYFKKMSYSDIASLIGLPFGQVRSRIQNGRRNLKICIEKNTIVD